MGSNTESWKLYLSPRFLVGRVREKGIIWCLKRGGSITGRWLYEFTYPTVKRIIWAFPSLHFLLWRSAQSEKRLLAILDLRVTPSTYGEALSFQEDTLIERILRGVDKIDIVWLCDADQPAREDQGITKDNYHYYLADRLPLAHINPYLGSFFLMDSPKMLEAYIRDNIGRYYIFPPLVDYLLVRKTYTGWFDRVQEFYHQHGYIPHLSCKPAMVTWARSFIKEKVRPQLPVVVNLRNRRDYAERNAKLDCWLEFFAFCEEKFSVKFVVVCGRDEIDPRFRNLPNVIIAKDYATTVEQDLALIQVSLVFMGGRSWGVAQMAIFSDIPYLMFNFRPINENIPHGSQLSFASPLQKLIWERETTESLIDEFTALFGKLDTSRWEQDFGRLASDSSTRLSRQP
jgi:hypothetical protein